MKMLAHPWFYTRNCKFMSACGCTMYRQDAIDASILVGKFNTLELPMPINDFWIRRAVK